MKKTIKLRRSYEDLKSSIKNLVPQFTYVEQLDDMDEYNEYFIEKFRISKILKDIINSPDDVSIERIVILKSMASSWRCCDVGNLCDALPRSARYFGAPQDDKLMKLGMLFNFFCHAIYNHIQYKGDPKYQYNSQDFYSVTISDMFENFCDGTGVDEYDFMPSLDHYIDVAESLDYNEFMKYTAGQALWVHEAIEKRAVEVLTDMGYNIIVNNELEPNEL